MSYMYNSACLQKYITCKGLRCFFYFKSRKSLHDEDVITIPWYDLQRYRIKFLLKKSTIIIKAIKIVTLFSAYEKS